MYICLFNFCDQSFKGSFCRAEFLPICFESALFETSVVLTTMIKGAVATFLWLIASLSAQSGMYQLIEKLLAYLSIVLHVPLLTVYIVCFLFDLHRYLSICQSIYYVSIHLSTYLSLFTTVSGRSRSGN